MKHYRYCIILVLLTLMTSCIEDKISTSPTEQPQFSVATLDMGTLFAEVPSPTFSIRVYNRFDRVMHIDRVALRHDDGTFRINIDGRSGNTAADIEIRPNDSIFLFVEATLPRARRPGAVDRTAFIDFDTNGMVTSLPVIASGYDVNRLSGPIDTDTRLSAEYPWLIDGSLTVNPGVTLTVDGGTVMHFHDGAQLRINGTLICDGTLDTPITMCGDRTGYVVADIPFDLMAGQWTGVEFGATSRNNRMAYTSVVNTTGGVRISGLPSQPVSLHLLNCRLHNSAGYVLESTGADLTATGCEFSDAASGVVLLSSGKYRMDHCTLANYYLFSIIEGAALQIGTTDTSLLLTNSIIYGLGSDISPADIASYNVTLRNTLLKSSGSDDATFIDCIWNADPLFLTDRNLYLFDYRPRPESPANGKADPAFALEGSEVDTFGADRSLTLGAYAPASGN